MDEKWRVLTYRYYDFDDNGRRVVGRTLHCFRNTTDKSWPGVEYAKLSVPDGTDAYDAQIIPGKEYLLTFNRFGKVVGIQPAPAA